MDIHLSEVHAHGTARTAPVVLAVLAVMLTVVAVALLAVDVDVEPVGDSAGYSCSPIGGEQPSIGCLSHVKGRLIGSALAGAAAGASALLAGALVGERRSFAGAGPSASLRAVGVLFAAFTVALMVLAAALPLLDVGCGCLEDRQAFRCVPQETDDAVNCANHIHNRLLSAAGAGVGAGLFGLLSFAVRRPAGR